MLIRDESFPPKPFQHSSDLFSSRASEESNISDCVEQVQKIWRFSAAWLSRARMWGVMAVDSRMNSMQSMKSKWNCRVKMPPFDLVCRRCYARLNLRKECSAVNRPHRESCCQMDHRRKLFDHRLLETMGSAYCVVFEGWRLNGTDSVTAALIVTTHWWHFADFES